MELYEALQVADRVLNQRAARLDRRLRKGNATDEEATRTEYAEVVQARRALEDVRLDIGAGILTVRARAE